MQVRRSLALLAGALLLAVPVLGGCGFNKATDRIYTPANGINYRQGQVFVLNAVIAAAQPNSGTLLASMSNQSTTQSTTLVGVAGAAGNTVVADDFAPISLQPQGFANLADGAGIHLRGQFQAGDILPISLNFKNGKTITMRVTVVYACQQYAGLDTSASESASSSPSALLTSAVPSDSATTTASGSESTSESTSDSASAGPSTGSSESASTEASGEPTEELPTAQPSNTAAGIGTPTADVSSYVCGTSGGTGGRN